jgi:putative ABC transport system permease protein
MKFLPLTFRNLMRRPVRTVLVFLATTVAFLLFGILMILRVAFTMGVEVAGADRLMMLNKMGFIQPIPVSYIEKIRAVPGVKLVTHASWMGGIYQDQSNNVFQFAVDPETYMAMYPEFKLPPDQMKAWLTDKQGFIAGRDLADRFGWTIGQKIPIQGTFNRPKGGDGVTWEFNLAGIYDGEAETDKTQFLFRWDYLDENRTLPPGNVGWVLIKVEEASRAGELSKTIDRLFENSSFETKTDTEGAMAQSFANQVGNIGAMVTGISAVVLFMVLLIAASQMSLAVRERTNEIGALKAMGFGDTQVLVLILVESMALSLAAGAVGLGIAWLLSLSGDPTGGFLPIWVLKPQDMAIGFGLAAAVGLIAGAMPAIGAGRLPIAVALRRG